MKRILLACCLLTATCIWTPKVVAQTATTVSVTDFNAKIALLDSYIGAGDMTNAQTTWNQVNTMMMSELSVTKMSIANATTDATRTTANNKMQNQVAIYRQAWTLKNDLAGNRAALHTKLTDFAGTF